MCLEVSEMLSLRMMRNLCEVSCAMFYAWCAILGAEVKQLTVHLVVTAGTWPQDGCRVKCLLLFLNIPSCPELSVEMLFFFLCWNLFPQLCLFTKKRKKKAREEKALYTCTYAKLKMSEQTGHFTFKIIAAL